MSVLWFCGAIFERFTGAALVSNAVFMLGLAAGRLVSFLIDGLPHALLVLYFVLEIVLGLLAVYLAGRHRRSGEQEL